jgi:hypothetical protein
MGNRGEFGRLASLTAGGQRCLGIVAPDDGQIVNLFAATATGAPGRSIEDRSDFPVSPEDRAVRLGDRRAAAALGLAAVLAACGGGADDLTLVETTPSIIKILVPSDLPEGIGTWLNTAERRAREHCAEYGRDALYIGRTPSARPGWPSVVSFACR